MTYTPFLISNYATGLDRELQPWLLPNDAFTDLLDGFVYRGVTRKRDGYSGFANGLKSTYTESRMVHQIAAVAPGTGSIDGANRTFTWTLTTPVARGRVVITGNNPAQVLTDNGVGGFTGNGTGTINYTTGAVSITFTLAPAVASTVLLTYSYHQGLPVMGVMSFYPTNNLRQMLVADTRYVNRYNPSTDRLDDIAAGTYTGTKIDFWSWVNYADPSSVPRLLFANGVVGDVIQVYNGTTIANYAPTFTPGTLNARQLFNVRDRLVLFQTIEAGTLYPRRIRISGTGVNSDNFDNTATGAGFIDIPDNTWFFGAAFNRDDVLFFTEAATWMMKYTGNDVTPFVLEKIDGSRGSGAAFSVISYLNRTMAASPRGLIISDGYQVERMDNNLPDFTFNDIDNDQSAFMACFSGFIDEDRDVYLLYPSQGDIRPPLVPAGSSDRILVINFEEDNYAIYRIPLSCMGNFQIANVILWSDLTAANGFPSWDALSETYDNWNSFPFSKGVPVAIGGGHKGEIWKLNNVEGEDNPLKIRDITVIDGDTLRVTTDWNNYNTGDYIVFESIAGMTQANHKQGAIKSIHTNYTVFDVDIPALGFSAYTSGGIASKVVVLEAVSKKLNPYISQDNRLRCGWIYFYVSVADTILTDDAGAVVPAFLDVDVITNDTEVDTNPTYKYRIDCTNLPTEIGGKKWVKIWINQVGIFVQFRLHNNQAGAKVQVHAMMPGLQPLKRII